MDEYRVLGWEDFFGGLSEFLRSADRQLGYANAQYTDFAVEKFEVCIRSLTVLKENLDEPLQDTLSDLSDEERRSVDSVRSDVATLVHLCRERHALWEQYQDALQTTVCSHSNVSYRAPTSLGRRGRPTFGIQKEQLLCLSSLGFSWTAIAKLLGVSRMTVYRRRRQFGLLVDPQNTLDDQELHTVLRQVKADHPTLGETMIQGHLRAMGYKVPRERVRRAIRVIDPLNTALRWKSLTPRQPYSVASPNSLWHIDGHHKLVRWRFVTHCGIDGYSRLVVYLQCSDNNRAATVYSSFLKAVQHYGLPSRVRSDEGGENVLVSRHMNERRGAERRSMITGSSVHNQRVERLWRDMHRCVTVLYYRCFYHLEYQDLMDPLNKHHLYALHYVYLPRLNKSLSEFKEGWNSHNVRTAGGKTPLQLYTQGMLTLQRSGLAAVDFFESVGELYGVEEEGLSTNGAEGVQVPIMRFQLLDEHYEQLRHATDPLRQSDNFGIDIYLETVEFVDNITSNHAALYM